MHEIIIIIIGSLASIVTTILWISPIKLIINTIKRKKDLIKHDKFIYYLSFINCSLWSIMGISTIFHPLYDTLEGIIIFIPNVIGSFTLLILILLTMKKTQINGL